jgi:hypothetical protein
MSRARREHVVIFQVKLWLIPGRDDDVIGYLSTVPRKRRAAAVVKAMRGGLEGLPPVPTEQDELNSILDNLGGAWLGEEG